MRGDRVTQCDRILGYLLDYEWHSSLEFVRMARPILSYTRRIHELRKHHSIEGKEVGNIHYYRLVRQ